jgi:hypothetical protein
MATLTDLIQSQVQISNFLQEFEEQFPKKVDSYAIIDDQISREIEYFKDLEREIATKRRQLENVQSRMKERVKMAFAALETRCVEGEYYVYKLVRSKPSLVLDQNIIPEKYKKQVVVVEIDRKMIEEDLKMGFGVDGACFKENDSMRRTLRTKAKEK